MNESSQAIQVSGLHKRFSKLEVLKGLDLDVPAGSIFGFLGLNGAGKTTLIRILLGLLKADDGRCSVVDVDPQTDEVVMKALEKEPGMRYQSMMEFFDALAAIKAQCQVPDLSFDLGSVLSMDRGANMSVDHNATTANLHFSTL